MAVKNLQTLVVCVANKHGVRVTGTECGSMLAGGKFQASHLFLLRHPFPGRMPTNAADNAATAPAVHRIGRSVRGIGATASTRLARTASRTVLSTRSSSTYASSERFEREYQPERKRTSEAASQRRWLPIRMAK
jgi:hypothetical protein